MQKNTFHIRWLLCSMLVGMVMTLGCDAYRANNPKYRLKAFYALLSATEREAFEAGDLESVTTSLDERLKQDTALEENWKHLKRKEAINFFSVQDVVFFFHENFYQRISVQKDKSQADKSP